MKDRNRDEYWFPAKRFGWGWGPPNRWQGWVVLLGFVAGLILNGVIFSPERCPAAFVAGIFVLTAGLIAICAVKGEPPRWRWGRDDLP